MKLGTLYDEFEDLFFNIFSFRETCLCFSPIKAEKCKCMLRFVETKRMGDKIHIKHNCTVTLPLYIPKVTLTLRIFFKFMVLLEIPCRLTKSSPVAILRKRRISAHLCVHVFSSSQFAKLSCIIFQFYWWGTYIHFRYEATKHVMNCVLISGKKLPYRFR